MNEETEKYLREFVSEGLIRQATQARQHWMNGNAAGLNQLIAQRRLPEIPWSDAQIRLLLAQIAMLDSNNFHDNAGLGEREARVFSPLVRERHFGY